jgi:hypothetical protein
MGNRSSHCVIVSLVVVIHLASAACISLQATDSSESLDGPAPYRINHLPSQEPVITCNFNASILAKIRAKQGEYCICFVFIEYCVYRFFLKARRVDIDCLWIVSSK